MLALIREGLVKQDLDLKKNYGSVVGTFQGRLPVMVVFDIEILKQVMIKECSNFPDRFARQ